jgi:hypothetical protein
VAVISVLLEVPDDAFRHGSGVFENPGHEFPQRIGYRRQGPSLQAWIEGTKDRQARRVEFPYRRAACPGD